MNLENNENQNNNALWLGLGLISGVIITYWLMKNKLDQKEQELNQTNQVKDQELKKIHEQVQALEQQIVKLNEGLNKKNQHSNSGFNLWSHLSQWLKKNLLN